MDYSEQYDEYLARANAALLSAAAGVLKDGSAVSEAARYSLIGGGKRVRAILCLAVCEMLCGDMDVAARYAAALEMLHCYSLIHDDLPCMDNDDTRRGQPSCHKKFGEATAMLAGDALLTAAFEVLAGTEKATAAQNADAVHTLAAAAGARGMVYGQELDLRFETQAATDAQLREVHRCKTGMLINAAAQLGAIAADAFREDREIVGRFAFVVGLVFQIVDDVLDATASEAQLGKPVHSDEKSNKTTFVTLYGPLTSMQMAREYTDEACEALTATFGAKAEFLVELARTLVQRKA